MVRIYNSYNLAIVENVKIEVPTFGDHVVAIATLNSKTESTKKEIVGGWQRCSSEIPKFIQLSHGEQT